MTTKSTRGGFREGAGRKASWGGSRKGAGRPNGLNTVNLCVRISPEAMEKLNAMECNKSQYINDLILEQ